MLYAKLDTLIYKISLWRVAFWENLLGGFNY